MPIFSNIFSRLLSSSIGNNIASDPEDIIATRRNFASLGRFDGDTELGFMDRKLDSSIRRFQGDMGLKVDGIMNPGGETERSLQRSLTRMESDQPGRISLFDGVGNNQTNRKEDVAQIQRGLSSIGLVPKARSFEPSGIIDTETTEALQSLQRRQGLKVDGMLQPGGETERTLNVLLSAATKTEGKGDGDKEPASPPPPDRKPEPPQKDPDKGEKPDERDPDEKEEKERKEKCRTLSIDLANAELKLQSAAAKSEEASSRIKPTLEELRQAREALTRIESEVATEVMLSPLPGKGRIPVIGVGITIEVGRRKIQKAKEKLSETRKTHEQAKSDEAFYNQKASDALSEIDDIRAEMEGISC